MDVLLESQLEAFFFNFLNFDFIISSLWAWVAVLTAALSFWQFKTVGSSHSPPTKSNGSPSLHHQQTLEDSQEPIQSLALACDFKPHIADDEVDGITKGMFNVYLEEDANAEDDGETEVAQGRDHEEEINVFEVDGVCSAVREVCCWDGMFVMRIRNLGWYHNQDLTAFNGSVVKLWEAKRPGCSQLEMVRW